MSSVRFRGVLVLPLAEQDDGVRIDPDGVVFEDVDYPLWPDFDHSAAVGQVRLRREGGGIMAEGTITGDDAKALSALRLSPGIALWAADVADSRYGRTVRSCRLNSVTLTGRHPDRGQPAIVEIR